MKNPFKLVIRKDNNYIFFDGKSPRKFGKELTDELLETADEIICYEYNGKGYQEIFRDINRKVGF